jgi:hypothetical protein
MNFLIKLSKIHETELMHSLIVGVLLSRSFFPFNGKFLAASLVVLIPIGFTLNYLSNQES